jgi:hypothetical protein
MFKTGVARLALCILLLSNTVVVFSTHVEGASDGPQQGREDYVSKTIRASTAAGDEDGPVPLLMWTIGHKM